MSRRLRNALLAAATTIVAALPRLATAPPAQAATPVRIMQFGDSITAGPGCWRAKLWHRLQNSGYTNIDFVGSQSDGGGCNPGYSYDFDHERHATVLQDDPNHVGGAVASRIGCRRSARSEQRDQLGVAGDGLANPRSSPVLALGARGRAMRSSSAESQALAGGLTRPQA
jgi:hypothetical protein